METDNLENSFRRVGCDRRGREVAVGEKKKGQRRLFGLGFVLFEMGENCSNAIGREHAESIIGEQIPGKSCREHGGAG